MVGYPENNAPYGREEGLLVQLQAYRKKFSLQGGS